MIWNWVLVAVGVALLVVGLFVSGSIMAAGFVAIGFGCSLVGLVRDDGQAR